MVDLFVNIFLLIVMRNLYYNYMIVKKYFVVLYGYLGWGVVKNVIIFIIG